MFVKLSDSFYFPVACAAVLLLSIQYSSTAPAIETLYAKFLSDMHSNKCTTPEEIKLPLTSSTTESVGYLSSYLEVCQHLESIEHNKEALYICREIFDNLKVILCPPISVKIIVNRGNLTLSNRVCEDFSSLKKNEVPENKVLLKRLMDNFTCELMCDEIFEKACQVLLWTYQLEMKSEQGESPNKVSKGNSLIQEITTVAGATKPREPIKAKESVQESAKAEQATQIAEQGKQQISNDLVHNIQKNEKFTGQQAQNQNGNEQPTNLNSNVQNSAVMPLKDPNANNPSLYQNEIENNSLSAKLKLSQVEGVNDNDVPDNDIESLKNNLSDMQEDPHDQEELLSHNEEAVVSNVAVAQTPANKKSPSLLTADKVPYLPNNGSPDLADKNELHIQVKEESPQPSANYGSVDPHDDEEVGEVESSQTDSRVPVAGVETNKVQDNPNPGNEGNVQFKITAQNGASSTKEQVTTKEETNAGNTKNSDATTDKKTSADVKTMPVGETSKSSVVQITSERPSFLPSQEAKTSSSVSPSSNEDSSPTVATLEKMEEDVHEMPENRPPDHYNGGLYEPSKTKETLPDKPNKVEVSKVDVSRPKEPMFNDFSTRDKYGHQSDEIPIMAVFPEQEDGHFFFYFLSIVLILMAGYLIFHNKQKIIALIVEGRHERRRRSHGVGYKKLETK